MFRVVVIAKRGKYDQWRHPNSEHKKKPPFSHRNPNFQLLSTIKRFHLRRPWKLYNSILLFSRKYLICKWNINIFSLSEPKEINQRNKRWQEIPQNANYAGTWGPPGAEGQGWVTVNSGKKRVNRFEKELKMGGIGVGMQLNTAGKIKLPMLLIFYSAIIPLIFWWRGGKLQKRRLCHVGSRRLTFICCQDSTGMC